MLRQKCRPTTEDLLFNLFYFSNDHFVNQVSCGKNLFRTVPVRNLVLFF